MLTWRSERGDTLIEVMLATVILAVVTVGTFGIMNRGIAMSQEVLERTEVRARLNEQLELATYFRDQYADARRTDVPLTAYPASVGNSIINRSMNSALVTGTAPSACAPNSGAFSLQRDATTNQYRLVDYPVAVTPPTTPTPGSGLWLEVAQSPGSAPVPYIDIYAKACWQTIGGNTGTQSSVMRLYVP